ncbi:hypothetical protein MCOR25_006985 [Pyricularia grisea]|uniref:Uncharacterized protein n=1 Tax=Pyricularia grisea TaxID=148305 RepID=A0A6P8BBR9_PYRGI|nr:uncharacterized protein PgNI_04055 [Pyricularia grisea]KAI6359657.1 hypothetical protein MCOR25_006985 [Pyricularia grisea]TLD13233.1 hypothetical protein PgNI_04055 [Pyricularia grisea]
MSAMHPPWVPSQNDHHSASDNDLICQDESLELYTPTDPQLCTPSPAAVFSGDYSTLALPEVDISASKINPGPPAIPRSNDTNLDRRFGAGRSPQPNLHRVPGIGSRIATSGSPDTASRVRKECRRQHTHPAITKLSRFPLVRVLAASECANQAAAESLTGGYGLVQQQIDWDDSEHEMVLDDAAPGSMPWRSRWEAPNSWFIFPSELRNQIYEHLIQLPTSHELYAEYYTQIRTYLSRKSQRRRDGGFISDDKTNKQDDEPFPTYKANLRTPSILLVSRAITDECLSILQTRILTVDRIPPWVPGAADPMRVSSFIGRATLQNLRHVDLRIDLGRGRHGSAWIWTKLAEDLLDVLAASSRLLSLRVVLRLFQTHNLRLWEFESGERYWYKRLLHKLDWFRANHSQVWSPPAIMIEYWEIRRDWVYLLDPSGRNPVATLGRVTDPKLVPGSITDFLAP